MATGTETWRNFEWKLSMNAGYRRILLLILILVALLSISYGFLLYQMRVLNLEQTAIYTVYQERELYLSKFYNSINKDELIKELYDVTGDGKYLDAIRENQLIMRQEFDSLYWYCQDNEEYCIRLDTSKRFLDLYIEVLLPDYEIAHRALGEPAGSTLDINRIISVEGRLKLRKEQVNAAEMLEILDQNHRILKDGIMEPTRGIVATDRDRTRTDRGILEEKTGRYHLWQKIALLLTLGLVSVLLFILFYIMLRPLEKPRPYYSSQPDQKYMVPYEGFEKELVTLLEQHHSIFRKYSSILMVFPRGGLFPHELKSAFEDFCESHQTPFLVREEFTPGDVEPGRAFVLLEDQTLAAFVEHAEQTGLEVGRDTGILGYGDNPLKRIVANGITVIQNLLDECIGPGVRSGKPMPGQCLKFIDRNSI